MRLSRIYSLILLLYWTIQGTALANTTFVDQQIIALLDTIARSGSSSAQVIESRQTLKALVDYRQQLLEQGATYREATNPDDEPLLAGSWSGQLEKITTDHTTPGNNGLRENTGWTLLHNNASYSLVFLGQPPIDLQSTGPVQLDGLQAGEQIIVTGMNTSNSFGQANASFLAAASASSAPACTATGNQHALVVAVNYHDDAASSPSINTVNNRHFGGSNSLAAYWQEASYGQVTLTGDTLGWHTLDSNVSSSNACLMRSEIRRQALEYAALTHDISLYNRLVIVMRDPAPACGWAGQSSSTCLVHTLDDGSQTSPMTTYWSLSSYQSNADQAVHLAAHEGGHNFGLGHANVRDWGKDEMGPVNDDSGSSFVELGDRYSSMGNPWLPHHYNTLHKLRLGWIDNSNIEQVNGNATVTLEAISTQPPFSTGKKAIKLYRGRSVLGQKEYLWLETRKRTGFDSQIANDGEDAIHVHQQRNSILETTVMLDMNPSMSTSLSDYLDAPISGGDSFTDSYTQITIDHMGTDGSGNVVVQISTPASHIDSDEDGLGAAMENLAGSNVNDEDSDDDGMLDSAEVCYDGDCSAYNPYPGGGDTSPMATDTDGDQMNDHWEFINGLNPVDPADKFLDPDNDGVNNYDEFLAGTSPQGADFDADGLDDGMESLLGTDPMNADSDSDGQTDGWEVDNSLNPLDASDAVLDPDLDGLDNLTEFGLGTDIYSTDSDNDGLIDPDEINLHSTDPADNDTDDDRLLDGEEVQLGLDPLTVSADTDGDGMNDHWETQRGTNPALDDAAVDYDRDNVQNIIEFLRYTLPADAASFPEVKTIIPDFSGLPADETGSQANPYIDRLNTIVATAEAGDTILLPGVHFLENASFSVTNHINLHGPADRSAVINAPIVGTSLNNWSEIRNITINASVVGLLANNTRFIGNDTIVGGGVVIQSANNTLIKNNTIRNSSGSNGVRVLSADKVTIANNTIVNYTNGIDNASGSNVVIENNILQNSTDLVGLPASVVQYNLISDGQMAGQNGNLDLTANFVNSAAFDLHLQANSAGIAMGNPDSDYEPEPQPNGFRINIGAYGGTVEATPITDGDNDGLPDSWELAFGISTTADSLNGDDDLDGYSNYHEYVTGSLPDDNLSTPALSGYDSDGDGFDNSVDNCPFFYNPGQADADVNGVGDACENEHNVPMLPGWILVILALAINAIARRSRTGFITSGKTH